MDFKNNINMFIKIHVIINKTSRQGTRAIMTGKIGVLGSSLRCLGLLVRDREDRCFVFDRSVTVEYPHPGLCDV